MRTIHVNTSKKYDIHIGEGLMAEAGNLIAQGAAPCTAAILTDENVAPLYLDTVEQSLDDAGFEVHSLILPEGEGSKSIHTLEDSLDFLCQKGLTRSDIIVALGGGVIGDAAGFAASVYLRGIRYVQMPTTFLAAVDSSVGGKTAVNLKAGKNLAGSFWQPELVVCDTASLDTLPQEVYEEGIAEAVKYGMIGSKELFDRLRTGMQREDVEAIIARCVAMKTEIVGEDEFDEGNRQLLNFGHTIGHAVEACSGFQIHHGHAVSIGMAIVTRATWHRGDCSEDCLLALEEALERNNLPLSCSYKAFELAHAAMADKKRRGENITLILPKTVGHCERVSIPAADLEHFIQAGLS